MPRMGWTAIAAILLAGGVGALYPEQLGVMGLKLSLVTMSGWIGYLLDRELFPYARPHECTDDWARQLRRASIVGATMVAMALAI